MHSGQQKPNNDNAGNVGKAEDQSEMQINQAPILNLPEEMVAEIFSYLKPHPSVALTCSFFNKVLNERLWLTYLNRDFPEKQHLWEQKNISLKALYQSLYQGAQSPPNLFFVLYVPYAGFYNDIIDFLNRKFTTKSAVINFINESFRNGYFKLMGHRTREDAVANADFLNGLKVYAVGFRFSEEELNYLEENKALPDDTSIDVYPKEISEKFHYKRECTDIMPLKFNKETKKFERKILVNENSNEPAPIKKTL